MTSQNSTRRRFIKLTGGATVGLASLTSSATAGTLEFTEAESPTGKSLKGAAHTSEGPYAVGSGGNVIRRETVSGDWVIVIDDGPAGKSNGLNGVDRTDDGDRIWFAGGSGVVGEYDVVTDTLVDYSAPKGKTSTWEDIAVQGTSGENERIYLSNGSGEVLEGKRKADGTIDFDDVVKPGGGSTIPGIDFHDRLNGHCCDTSQGVYQADQGNDDWEKIGIKNTSVVFNDLGSVSDSDITVVGGSGTMFYYNGDRWTGFSVSENAVRAVDRDDEFGLAAGNGGMIYERESATDWTAMDTPTGNDLLGVANDPVGTFPDVAVGSSGTIVERTG